jgi:hypothetical protein
MFGTRSIEGLYFNICHATVRLHFALIQRDSPRPLFEADHGIASYHIRFIFAHPIPSPLKSRRKKPGRGGELAY